MVRQTTLRSDAETIRNAIEDLEDNLRRAMPPDEAVEAAATDNECAPALLKRAFETKHQCSVLQWKPPATRREMARRVASASAVAKAKMATWHDPLVGHASVPEAYFLVPPGTIIAIGQAEVAISYLLDKSVERSHARVVGYAVEPEKLAPLVGLKGERDIVLHLKLGSGKLVLPGLDGMDLKELHAEVLARVVAHPEADDADGGGGGTAAGPGSAS